MMKFLSIAALTLGVGMTGHLALAHNGEVHDGMNMAMATTSTSGNMVNVQVMNHLCNAKIKNVEDFKALEAGKDPVAALANTVLNCPTTGLPGNEAAMGTVASPRTMYEFSVMGEHNNAMMLKDSMFMQHKISEADVNIDVDGNGMISSSTALDISHYEFHNMMADNGRVEVIETMPAMGYHFGTLRFTPTVIDGNNDRESLLAVDPVQGRIQLDMSNDKDKTVMLHVYNFRNDAGSVSTSTGTSTSPSTDRAAIMMQIQALQHQIEELQMKLNNLPQ